MRTGQVQLSVPIDVALLSNQRQFLRAAELFDGRLPLTGGGAIKAGFQTQ